MGAVESARPLDAIEGCLVGGAAGDALGYPVEFMGWGAIAAKYGAGGIRAYQLDGGLARVSDDTQMTLFTACGILYGETRGRMRGIMAPIEEYVHIAYLDWLLTQGHSVQHPRVSWILDVPELHAPRAPGNTCLSALRSGRRGSLEAPINRSKGCGGVMRVAPVALYYGPERLTDEQAAMTGARVAAITHGHPLGYLSAGALTYLLRRVVHGGRGEGLKRLTAECLDAMRALFPGEPEVSALAEILNEAVRLSESAGDARDHIENLGEGWVAEEALAIALYCCLRYEGDFSASVIAAVNHGGDSDSTGAIAGNIAGAQAGTQAIPEVWKRNLELLDVIREIAADLAYGCPMSECGPHYDAAWAGKYLRNR